MKKLILLAALGWFSLQSRADDWVTNLPNALVQAKAENKWVLMDFTGSDWCPPCIQLHKRVLDTPEFMAFAKTNLVLMIVDFPLKPPLPEAREKENHDLKEKYEVDGFPTLVVLNSEGKVVTNYFPFIGVKTKQFIANLKKLEHEKKP